MLNIIQGFAIFTPAIYHRATMIYYLVYTSKGSPILTEHTLKDILTQSRQNNSMLDITGILLYSKSQFIQVLEGEKEKVTKLYEKIAADPRHTLVSKRIEGFAAERNFATWAMGYKSIITNESDGAHGYLNIAEDNIIIGDDVEDNPVLLLLKKYL